VKNSTYRTYTIGFALSIILTLGAYYLVTHQLASGGAFWSLSLVITTIIALAIIQLLVQLLYFLHLGQESKPRWNLMVLSFAAMVVLILVLGSLWIMKNLSYHTMSPADTNATIIKDEGIYK
jgi:cytochrome o ubiquinol oxidase subunit IV